MTATADERERAADRPPALPRSARRLLALTVIAAAALAAAAVDHDRTGFVLWHAAALAAAIAGGEGFRVDLPYRRGGVARFTLGDAALTAGLLLVSPAEVILAAAAGITLWQVLERAPRVKFAVNVSQYVVGAAAASIVVSVLAAGHGPLEPRTFAAAALGVLLFLIANTVTVGGMIALTSGRALGAVLAELVPTCAVLAAGNAGLGLLAVLLAASHPWALPALAVPLALIYTASRQSIGARVSRERSSAFVAAEQRLSQATTSDDVSATLVGAVADILGCRAAVWSDGRWRTPVPPGSTACPVDASLAVALRAPGTTLGPAVERCTAIGVGGGVLVAWSGDLPLDGEAELWLERLARSGRASFARTRTARALAQERATLRAVVDGTGDGIVAVDGDGVVRLWNPAMTRLTGRAAEDALGSPALDVLGSGPWTEPGVHEVQADERTWRVSIDVVSDREQGELRVAVVHDVSAEHRVKRMKDDMLAVVSHELRTPLTPIKASAQLLNRRWNRLGEAQRGELLSQIERRADHLARLVDDLLLVAQLSAAADAQPRLMPTAADLSALVREHVAQLSLVHPGRTIALSAPPTLPALTDPLRVRQIVDNLVDNACKFSPDGTDVEVRLDADGERAVLRVTDHGRGIASEDVERVFERFERVEDPLHMTTSGAGLGLYIVRALVTALGGSITVESTVGVGTTFTVVLPIPAIPQRRASDRAPAAVTAIA